MARKAKPYDPAAAALEAARVRERERERRRDPANWAVANDTLELPTGDEVIKHVSKHKREVFAKRVDPFESLYRAGGRDDGGKPKGINLAQYRAAMRLFEDWCSSQGIKTRDSKPIMEVVDRPQRGPSDLINVRMMDAGKRYEEALREVGRSDASVLKALIQPAVMCGSVLIWRGEVERVTMESDATAQAVVVRRACENLLQAYEVIDRAAALRSREAPLAQAVM